MIVTVKTRGSRQKTVYTIVCKVEYAETGDLIKDLKGELIGGQTLKRMLTKIRDALKAAR